MPFGGQPLDARNEPRPDVQTRLEQVAQRLDARLDAIDLKLDALRDRLTRMEKKSP